LTGFYTHGFLEMELTGALARAKAEQSNFTYLMIDLDKFKHVNDQYGHAAGNQLLMAVTQTIRSVLRATDIPARFGGDEFEILLPRTNKLEGLACAKKIHKAVEREEFTIAEGIQVHMTLSMGLASYPEDAKTAAQLQAAADSALYDAKALGRNGIVVYGDNLKHLADKLSKHRSTEPAAPKEARL
jgi:diguanylate cyclase (GGDEF)-like protein